MNLDWRARYRFTRGRLTQVLLFTDYTQSRRASLLKRLSQDFHLAAMKSGRKVLDLVRLGSRDKGSKFRRTRDRFEKKGLGRSDLVYVFLEKTGLNRRAKKARSFREMMIKMSVLTREVDVFVESNGHGKRIVLSVAMPRAALRLKPHLEKAARQPAKESERVRTYTPPKSKPSNFSYKPLVEPFIRGEGRL